MKKVIISGFGGQGVLSLGKFIAESALSQKWNTSWMPSYGPEMRGGTCNCTVQYDAKNEIAAPVVDSIDILVALNDPSMAKFAPKVVKGGIIVTNSNIVVNTKVNKDAKVYEVPVQDLALKAGNPRGGNVIMLGILVGLVGDFSFEAAEDAVRKSFADKPKVIEPNIACLKAGIEFAKGLK